nr:hypothetical protein [Tanacetum cinerariifolium]
MIFESVENGPLLWPLIEENRVTRPNKYSELSAMEAIQADCDVKATNIILQGLPPEVRECKLYDEFDKFAYKKEESLHPLALVATHQMTQSPYQTHQHSYQHTQLQPQVSSYQSSQYGSHTQSSTPLSIIYPPNDFQSSVHHNVYNPSSSIPQVEYAPSVNQQPDFSQPDSGLIVPVFQKGDDPIDAINHMMSFLTDVVTSWYPPINNQLRNSSNPRQQATINNGRVIIALMANLSHYGSDDLAEVHNQDNVTHNVVNQVVKAMPLSEQSNIMNQSETEITSVNYNKINLDNKNVNETLTAELARYKDQVRILKEGNNVEKSSDSCARSVEINNLKQTLSEHLKENESLKQMVTLHKNDFQKEESRNIDRELALEKQIKELDSIVFKRNQSAQTVHMLTKPQFFYDHTTKQALEILMLAEESCSKMLLKQKDPMMSEKKVNTKPVDYAALNQLSQDFETRFVPQTELSAEQVFWYQNFVNSEEPNLFTRPTQVEVPKELSKVSMVNTSLKKLKHHLASFDVLVKERTTATAITEGTWRLLEQAINKDIVNIVVTSTVNNAYEPVHKCERCVKLETELQKDFIKRESYNKLFKQYITLEKQCISLEVDTQHEQEIFQSDNSFSQQSVPSFDQLFEMNELNAQSQEKDIVIKKLKERIKSLSGNMKEEKIKQELEEIKTINIMLDHRVTKLIAENEHLKQTYKQLYDSIKSSRIRSKEQCDDLIKQANIKSAENFDLNASLWEKVLVITTLKRYLKET